MNTIILLFFVAVALRLTSLVKSAIIPLIIRIVQEEKLMKKSFSNY